MTTPVAPPRARTAPRVRPMPPVAEPAIVPPAPKRKEEGKWFLNALSVILLGYAVLGKPFAYLGFPPLYVGEVVLSLGVLTVLRYPSMVGAMMRAPLFPLLAIFVLWNAACTIPYIPEYRWDALRDGALWGYSAFALLVYGILVRHPEGTNRAFARYRTFAIFFTLAVTVGLVYRLTGNPLPFLGPRLSEMGVHLGGVIAYLTFSGGPAAISLFTLVPVISVMSGNRGGTLGMLSGVALSGALTKNKSRFVGVLYGLVAVLFFMFLLDVQIGEGRRPFSVQTILNNFGTVIQAARVNPADDPEADPTSQWRMFWWKKIIGYTFEGEYFWTGKGYGLNVAVDDGYESPRRDPSDRPLRSPHNSHLTFLARSGVPGIVLWVTLQLSWALAVLNRMLRSRNIALRQWYGRFAFILCYWIAFIVNAAFEVSLEGPMSGIWFWVVFGVGLASIETFDAERKGSPLITAHGSAVRLLPPDLHRRKHDRATSNGHANGGGEQTK